MAVKVWLKGVPRLAVARAGLVTETTAVALITVTVVVLKQPLVLVTVTE